MTRPGTTSKPVRASLLPWASGSPRVGGAQAIEMKIVAITGVTKGLGRALAIELANRGHTIAGCGRVEVKLEELKREVPRERHLRRRADVAFEADVSSFAQEVVATVGVPNIVVNCAGIINQNARLWDVSASEFSAVITANLDGTANVIRHFVPHMIQKKFGVIVNFSSAWGRSAAAEGSWLR